MSFNKTKNISLFLILNEIKLDMRSHSTFINDKKIPNKISIILLIEALIKNQGRVLSRRSVVKPIKNQGR